MLNVEVSTLNVDWETAAKRSLIQQLTFKIQRLLFFFSWARSKAIWPGRERAGEAGTRSVAPGFSRGGSKSSQSSQPALAGGRGAYRPLKRAHIAWALEIPRLKPGATDLAPASPALPALVAVTSDRALPAILSDTIVPAGSYTASKATLNVEWATAAKRSLIEHLPFNIQHSTFALFITLLLAGCAAHPTDHRERLDFWALGSEGEFVQNLIPEFERQNPGIHVVIQQIPWSAAHEKLLTAFVGEATPDLAQMGNTWLPEFSAIHALDDLGPFVASSKVVPRSDYFPGIWSTNVIDGTLCGIPWYVDTRVLFFRSDILAAVGFPRGPRTWAEWREAMLRIKQQGRSRWAMLLPTNEWDPITNLGLSAHSTILTPDGTRGAFSQPQFADAFNFYIDIFREGFAPRVSNSQIANLYQQFAQGDFAMYLSGPWNVGEFRRRLPPEMQGKWATAPLPAHDASEPTGISMAGGGSFVIFRASQHKAAARKLIEFLSQPKQQVRFFELTGDLPARRSAWLSPILANDTHFPAFRVQLERVEPLPKVPEWEQIATAIFDRGEAAARGTVTTTAALKQLDVRADELLEKRRWMIQKNGGETAALQR
jgi:multiple sugar transport system substrate-binding protein